MFQYIAGVQNKLKLSRSAQLYRTTYLSPVKHIDWGPELIEVDVRGVEPICGDGHILKEGGETQQADDHDDDDDHDHHDVLDDEVPDVEPECVAGTEAGEQGVDDPQLEEVETYNQDVCPGHLVECHQVVSR